MRASFLPTSRRFVTALGAVALAAQTVSACADVKPDEYHPPDAPVVTPDHDDGGGNGGGSNDGSAGQVADATLEASDTPREDAGAVQADAATDGASGSHVTDASAADANAPVQRRLYVTNDTTGAIDVFDIDNGHQLVRSISLGVGHRFRGIAANVASGMLYLTDGDAFAAMGVDLTTDAIVWKFYYAMNDCNFPDRLSVSLDGKYFYMPCKYSQKVKVMAAKTGLYIKDINNITQDAHNSFTGETGKYMYLSARSGGPMYLVDPKTNNVVKTIGPFSSPVRPFSVNADESYFFANLTDLLGFAVGNIATGAITEITQVTPPARTMYAGADGGIAHGDDPKSHGLAVRPGSKEVWFLDDQWGYLYAYDITHMPPTHLADIPLFSDITKAWGFGAFRWLAFDIRGQYAYPSDGSVVDANTRTVIPNQHISPSEKLLEVDFQNGKVVQVGGQNGGVYN